MKNLVLPLVLFISALGFCQSEKEHDLEVRKEVRMESVHVVVTVDSAEELEATFTSEDIKDMFDFIDEDETISFKLVCNGEPMSNGKKSYMSYKIEGTASDHETFVKRVNTIRKAAIKYYNNKN